MNLLTAPLDTPEQRLEFSRYLAGLAAEAFRRNAEMDELQYGPTGQEKAIMSHVDGIYCRKCGAGIATGFSWNGWCVVCAEPHVKAEQDSGPKWLADVIAKVRRDALAKDSPKP